MIPQTLYVTYVNPTTKFEFLLNIIFASLVGPLEGLKPRIPSIEESKAIVYSILSIWVSKKLSRLIIAMK